MSNRTNLLRGLRRAFNPIQISRSVLKAWHCADDLTAGSVATWTDRINGVALTAAGAAQPVCRDTVMNGRKGVWFDGVDDRMSDTATFASHLPTGTSAGWSLTVVWNANLDTTQRRPYAYGSSANWRSTYGLNNNHSVGVDTSAASFTGTQTKLAGLLILVAQFTDGLLSSRVNGASNGSLAASLNTGTTRYSIGGSPTTSGSSFWHGAIRHVFQFAVAPDLDLIQQMEGWAADDLGLNYQLLPRDHPYWQGPQQYTLAENLTALKATMDAAEGQPVPDDSALYSPTPTISYETTDDLPTGYGRQATVTNTPGLFRTMTGWVENDGVYFRAPAGILSQPGTPLGGRLVRTLNRLPFKINASAVAIQFKGSTLTTQRLRLVIKQGGTFKYVSAAGEVGLTTSEDTWIKYDLGSKAEYDLYFETEKAVLVKAVAVPTGDSIEPPDLPDYCDTWDMTADFVGDSITNAVGADYDFDGYVPKTCDRLGVPLMFPNGNVGTSWIYNGSQDLMNGLQRLNDSSDYDRALRISLGVATNSYTNTRLTYGALGINAIGNVDPALEAAALEDFLDQHTRVRPGVPVLVLGPFDARAPLSPTAAYVAMSAALSAVCAGRQNVRFIDMTGVAYAKVDATHPTSAGATTLAIYIAQQSLVEIDDMLASL